MSEPQIKSGDKQTEVGVIPKDWAVAPLGILLQGPPRYGINAAAVPYDGNLHTYLRITDIDRSGRFAPSPRVSVRHPQAEDFVLAPGDVVIARTGATVGKSYRYNPADGPLVFAGFLICVSPSEEMLIPGFFAHYAQSRSFWNWVATASARSGQPGINGNEIGICPTPLPPLPEQRAIAGALSDADALIDALDQLIAKKRNLKQAAMQQLLTGKKRLPGFTGKWEKRMLGEIGNTYGGLTGKTKSDFGTGDSQYIPFLNIMSNVVIDPFFMELVRVSATERQHQARKGDIFFNGSSETPEEVGMCSVLLDDLNGHYLNSFCFGFRLHDVATADGLYLAYLFRSRQGRELLYSLAQGATRYNLSKTSLLRLVFPLPKVSEQSAIATVLSDMDAEIAALESRRNKTRDLKQGMMQELLTGRIRLINPATQTEPAPQPIAKIGPALMPPKTSGHNWKFNEAVVIAVLAANFGSEAYPLGRMRYTKLSYLLHRRAEGKAQGYLKKAAGPYNPGTKYAGPEKIAQQRKYIHQHTRAQFTGFVAAEEIAEAQAYFEKWYGTEAIPWLEQFRLKTNDDLEVLTTIDMATQDLLQAGKPVSLESVKQVIRNQPEWRAKLRKPHFSEENIRAAIAERDQILD